MQVDGKWMPRNKAIITVWLVAMAKLVKELTNIYWISEKHHKTSCLLQQTFQTTAAHSGEKWVWTTCVHNEELSSRVEVSSPMLQSDRVYRVILLHFAKVRLYSSNFLRASQPSQQHKHVISAKGLYYGISTAHRWFTRNCHRSLWTWGLHQALKNT